MGEIFIESVNNSKTDFHILKPKFSIFFSFQRVSFAF